jgi:hypothetical protein
MKRTISGHSFKGLQLSVRITFYDAKEQNRIEVSCNLEDKVFYFLKVLNIRGLLDVLGGKTLCFYTAKDGGITLLRELGGSNWGFARKVETYLREESSL